MQYKGRYPGLQYITITAVAQHDTPVECKLNGALQLSLGHAADEGF